MPTLTVVAQISIYLVMALSILAALGVVLLRNLFHAALALVLVLLGTAAIYFVLHAEFLAVSQILIYVGAVMTLVIFVVMLTSNLTEKNLNAHNAQSLVAAAAAIVFLVPLVKMLVRTPWPVDPRAVNATYTTASLGASFMGTYVFPFEVISIVLIAALIGAIVVARRDK